jgi:hypothetical protein
MRDRSTQHARSVLALGALALFVLAATPALRRAEVSREGATLSWVRQPSAARCPSVEALAQSVDARLGRDHRTAGTRLVVESLVSRENARWIARITLYDGEGARVGQRVISSASGDCASLLDASSLAIALAIDPTAVLHRMDAGVSESVDAADVSAPRDTFLHDASPDNDASMDGLRDAMGREDVRSLGPRASFDGGLARPDAATPGPSVHGALRAVGAVGALPAPAPGAEISLATQWSRWFSVSLGMVILPEQRASESLAFGQSQLWLAPCGGVALGWGRADGCVRVAGELVHAYALGAPGVRPVAPGSYGALSLGPTARLTLEPLRARGWGPRIELEIAAMIGLVRPEFVLLATPTQRWQSAPVSVYGSAGVGF